MKKISYTMVATGFMIWGIATSCDFLEHPVIVIPMLIGTMLMIIGYILGKDWVEEDEEDYSNTLSDSNDAPNRTFVTYDLKGAEHTMCE